MIDRSKCPMLPDFSELTAQQLAKIARRPLRCVNCGEVLELACNGTTFGSQFVLVRRDTLAEMNLEDGPVDDLAAHAPVPRKLMGGSFGLENTEPPRHSAEVEDEDDADYDAIAGDAALRSLPRSPSRVVHYKPKPCVICGDIFTPHSGRVTICQKPECQANR